MGCASGDSSKILAVDADAQRTAHTHAARCSVMHPSSLCFGLTLGAFRTATGPHGIAIGLVFRTHSQLVYLRQAAELYMLAVQLVLPSLAPQAINMSVVGTPIRSCREWAVVIEVAPLHALVACTYPVTSCTCIVL